MSDSTENASGIDLRYSVDESPPPLLPSMLAAQTVLLIVAGIVITPAIVLRGANMPVSMEAGVIFFALPISGAVTILRARPMWRFGAGYILLMGTSGAFIAVGITALKLGATSEGPSSTGQLSLRILTGIAENIRHFQFHGLDFISLTLSTNLSSIRNRQTI